MANIFKKMFYSRPIQAYIRFMQKILVTIFLTLLYFLVTPFTWLLIVIFKRQMLYPKMQSENTYWIEAKDYSSEFETNLHQS